MITKEIAPHTRPVYNYNYGYGAAPQRVFPPFTPTPTGTICLPDSRREGRSLISASPNAMSKLEFDMFVGKIPFKIGDYLVSKFSEKPYKANQVHKLIYINEMHRFVDSWATMDVGPIIFTLQGVNPHSNPFKGGANMWNKVELADLPDEWKSQDNILKALL